MIPDTIKWPNSYSFKIKCFFLDFDRTKSSLLKKNEKM